jgi:hypothetical protein
MEQLVRAVHAKRKSAEQLVRTRSRVQSSKDEGARRGRRIAVVGWRRAVVQNLKLYCILQFRDININSKII